MEETIIMIPALIVIGGLGIVIGMYITSQIKEHISSNINRKELIKNLEEKEKTKQQESKIYGQKPIKGKERN